MTKFNTNEEFIADLMCHSPHGALCQTFIIEAIRYYATKVSETSPPDAANDNGFISAIAWHNIANDIIERMDKQYGSH